MCITYTVQLLAFLCGWNSIPWLRFDKLNFIEFFYSYLFDIGFIDLFRHPLWFILRSRDGFFPSFRSPCFGIHRTGRGCGRFPSISAKRRERSQPLLWRNGMWVVSWDCSWTKVDLFAGTLFGPSERSLLLSFGSVVAMGPVLWVRTLVDGYNTARHRETVIAMNS